MITTAPILVSNTYIGINNDTEENNNRHKPQYNYNISLLKFQVIIK